MKTQFFERSGAKIAFDVALPSSGEVDQLLVLVNGYRRPRSDFRALRKRLHKLCPQLATLGLDNRFCGETTPLPEDNGNPVFSLQDMAEDVQAIAQHVREELLLDTYALLGISMGGMVAQTCAANNPEIHQLFLVSTTAGGRGRFPPLSPGPLPTFKDPFTSLEETKRHMRRYFGEAFLKKSPLLFEMMCKTMVRQEKSPHHISSTMGAQLQFAVSVGFDGVQQLAQIHIPTTIFSGDQDHVIHLESANFLNKNIPQSRLVVYPGVGHLILMEEPDKFSEDVAEILSKGEDYGIRRR